MATIATIYGEALGATSAVSLGEIVVAEGPDAGRATEVGRGACVVGTAAQCELVLTDGRVSSRHVSIALEGTGFRVEDLGSKNGTLYQGSRLDSALLPRGAAIKVGRTLLRLQPEARPVEIQPSQARRFGDLHGQSLAIREVFAVLELAAQSEVTVLIEGETGVGKELAARALHDASDRRARPFVAVDCGALPPNLVESELFGHVRGAFTGAARDRKGAFARAAGGTLFLDELDGVASDVQARLLRALEERRVRPVGSDREVEVDVRVVAASRVDLASRVADGDFRADLYYRVAVLRITVPPLRERREDIPLILAALLQRRGFEPGAVEGPTLDRLQAHDWPGNARELRNVLDRALVLSPRATRFSELRIDARPGSEIAAPLTVRTDLPFGEAKAHILGEFERRYLTDLMARCDGNVSAASRACGVDRKHLRSLLAKHGLV